MTHTRRTLCTECQVDPQGRSRHDEEQYNPAKTRTHTIQPEASHFTD